MTLVEISYTLQWEDDRLFQHPCYGALENMLSMGLEMGQSDNARSAKQQVLDQFWTSKLSAHNLVPQFAIFDEFSTYDISRVAPWSAGIGPWHGHANAPQNCTNCVTREAAVELELVLSHFDFYFYPFDQQIFKLRLQVEGAHLYTCSNLTALQHMLPLDTIDEVEHKFLPFTKEWYLGSSAGQSLRMFHPTVNGVIRYDMCDLELRIGRTAAASRTRALAFGPRMAHRVGIRLSRLVLQQALSSSSLSNR